MINFNLTECDPDKLLKEFTEKFKGQYGVEYISALHYNKTKTNYHIHLIFSERWLLEAPDNKISTHAVYFDKTGKRIRTKKKITGENEAIRKGKIYDQHMFATKDTLFQKQGFSGRGKGAADRADQPSCPEGRKVKEAGIKSSEAFLMRQR